MPKLFRIVLLGLFFSGVAACSKGGDENANNAQPAADKAQQVAPKGGYDPNADADSDC